jgi:hypothetical protein
MSYYVMGAMVLSTLVSAQAQRQQGQVAKQVGRNNQILAEQAAQDAERRGGENAMAVRRRGDQTKGAQRAAQAASGLDLGVGTAAELQDQTSFFSDTDQKTARMNAAREAWSARAQGANYRFQGDTALSQANLSATGTLIGGASQVAGRWYQYGGRGGPSNYNSGLDVSYQKNPGDR